MWNRKFILSIILVMLILGSFQYMLALPQIAIPDSTAKIGESQQIDPELLTNIKSLRSLWDIILLAGWWRWFLIGDFVLGMMVVLYKATEFLLDKQHSRELENLI